jgi:hypothetical protein
MPLPTGTWKMNINGKELDFTIQSVQEGGFSALLLGQSHAGFWDEVSQTITFGLTKAEQGDVSGVAAVFKGYLFRSPENPAPGRDVVATLAGSVQVSIGSFAAANLITSSRRNVFGWFAQITEVL